MARWSNPWLWACFIGDTYGAACSARGKIVPLLSRASGYSNPMVSGAINAALAIGLITGTIAGSFVSQTVASPKMTTAKHRTKVSSSRTENRRIQPKSRYRIRRSCHLRRHHHQPLPGSTKFRIAPLR
jgi:hypothetical protein